MTVKDQRYRQRYWSTTYTWLPISSRPNYARISFSRYRYQYSSFSYKSL